MGTRHFLDHDEWERAELVKKWYAALPTVKNSTFYVIETPEKEKGIVQSIYYILITSQILPFLVKD